jgi:hypothetical protein
MPKMPLNRLTLSLHLQHRHRAWSRLAPMEGKGALTAAQISMVGE